MRTLLALALLSPVAFGQDEDPVPVAPPPRLKAVATTKKKAPPRIDTTLKVDPEPKPVTKVEATPVPKTNPVPEAAPKTAAKADPTPPPAPKAEPPVAPKAEPNTDVKAETKPEVKDDKPAPAAVPAVKFPEPAFNDYQLPLYALGVVGVVAAMVVIRSYALPPKA